MTTVEPGDDNAQPEPDWTVMAPVHAVATLGLAEAVVLSQLHFLSRKKHEVVAGLGLLVRATGISDRTLRRVGYRLEEQGLVTVARVDGLRNRYRLTDAAVRYLKVDLDCPRCFPPQQDVHPRTTCTPAGDAPPQDVHPSPAGDAPPPANHPVQTVRVPRPNRQGTQAKPSGYPARLDAQQEHEDSSSRETKSMKNEEPQPPALTKKKQRAARLTLDETCRAEDCTYEAVDDGWCMIHSLVHLDEEIEQKRQDTSISKKNAPLVRKIRCGEEGCNYWSFDRTPWCKVHAKRHAD